MNENELGYDVGWSPLWSTIIKSTLWGESKEVKILFVTMLALKDKYGKVTGTTAGLSRAAVLTFEETAAALKVLENPDSKSDTYQEFEGRRIKRVQGGWVVLNHSKYKELVGNLKRRKYQADWMAEKRKIDGALREGIELDTTELSDAGLKRWQKAKADQRAAENSEHGDCGKSHSSGKHEVGLKDINSMVEHGYIPNASIEPDF